jgi:hypothetical protein
MFTGSPCFSWNYAASLFAWNLLRASFDRQRVRSPKKADVIAKQNGIWLILAVFGLGLGFLEKHVRRAIPELDFSGDLQ